MIQVSTRTPGTSGICVYEEGARKCRSEGVGELRGHYYINFNGGIPWTMCETHMQISAHPKDLQNKLVRWTDGPE
jgi:hypothetical protein